MVLGIIDQENSDIEKAKSRVLTMGTIKELSDFFYKISKSSDKVGKKTQVNLRLSTEIAIARILSQTTNSKIEKVQRLEKLLKNTFDNPQMAEWKMDYQKSIIEYLSGLEASLKSKNPEVVQLNMFDKIIQKQSVITPHEEQVIVPQEKQVLKPQKNQEITPEKNQISLDGKRFLGDMPKEPKKKKKDVLYKTPKLQRQADQLLLHAVELATSIEKIESGYFLKIRSFDGADQDVFIKNLTEGYEALISDIQQTIDKFVENHKSLISQLDGLYPGILLNNTINDINKELASMQQSKNIFQYAKLLSLGKKTPIGTIITKIKYIF